MANASEKLKELGLRHGEKVVMVLAVASCVACLAMAATRPTIDMTPEEIAQHARSAASNLEQKQSTEDILKRIEEAGIKNPHFVQMVVDQEKNALVADAFRPPHPYIYPQPGAGLIRDMPELIAPTDLIAYPGRGGALVYELDPNTGQRIIDEEAKAAAMTGAPGTPEGAMGFRRKSSEALARREAQAKKELEREFAKRKAMFLGKEAQAKEEVAAPTGPQGPFKETTKGLRWVSITGVLDYKKLRENYLAALKVESVAYPHFKQVDVERQTRDAEGTWSDWEAVDAERNHAILDNLPEVEEEYADPKALLDALVDPLPFLKAGYWERVHVARLVPQEKIKALTVAPQVTAGPMMGEYGGSPPLPQMMERPPMQIPSEYGYGGMMMSSGSTEAITFPTTQADEVMVRSLDFTVDPDKTYRYRVRIVVFNPNRDREDVAPGVDTSSIELFGPWSEPTDEVTMPADVTAYVVAKGLSDARKKEQVQFDVARWDPQSGITVEKRYDAMPGEIVGDYNKITRIPSQDVKEAKAPIDFNSHEVVLDANGGDQPVTHIPGGTGRFSVPVQALLVRSDGSVILRDQALDVSDEVRKDIEQNYKRELEESGKMRQSSMGEGAMMGYPGAYPR